MFKIDHHIHTSRHSPDSVIDPDDLVRVARERGLDGVVITEHDYLWTAEETAELAARARGLVVLPGVEVSAVEGHFLIYGITNPFAMPPGIRLRDLVRRARAQGAAIVAAHPFRWNQPFDRLLHEVQGGFDAVEVVSNNHTVATRRRTEEAAGKYPHLAFTGSSDAHEVATIGCYYSEVDRPIATIQDFVAALKNREIRPRHDPKSDRRACGEVA